MPAQHLPLRYYPLITLFVCAMLALVYPDAAAHADGGYLHMSEANALARKVADKQARQGGRVSLLPCEHSSSRTAVCVMRLDKGAITCGSLIRVKKRYARGRYAWSAKAGKFDCEYRG